MQSLVKKGPMHAIFRHNKLRDILPRCTFTGISPSGSRAQHRPLPPVITGRYSCTGLESRKPAAFDVCVVSPLNSNVLSAVGATAGAASEAAELRKHTANDAKCAELGWVSHPSCGGVLRGMGQGGSTLFISTWVSPCYPQLLRHL